MAGKVLGCKPGVIEKAKFEYAPVGKVFNKRLDEKDNKEGLSKRLKNIEGKNENQLEEIVYQGKRQLDMIDKQGKKQLKAINKQEQLLGKKLRVKKKQATNKSGKNGLSKDTYNDILMTFDINFTNKGENILKKVATDERMINYDNLFFKQVILVLIILIFFKRFDTSYDLLINLLREKKSTNVAAKERNEMVDKIEELKDFILVEEKNITKKQTQSIIKKAKIKTQREKFLRYNKVF